MRHLIFIALFAVSGLAFANGSETGHNNGNGHNKHHNDIPPQQDVEIDNNNVNQNANTNLNLNENNSSANSASNSTSISLAEGGSAEQSQGQSQGQSSFNANDNSNSSNNSASQNTNVTFQAAKTYRNTPSAYAPSVYASGICTGGGFGVGASSPGYGISIGGSKIDKECNLRETARLLGGLGYDQTGFVLLCEQLPAVKQANGGNCTPPVTAPPVAIPEPEVTPTPIPVITGNVKG